MERRTFHNGKKLGNLFIGNDEKISQKLAFIPTIITKESTDASSLADKLVSYSPVSNPDRLIAPFIVTSPHELDLSPILLSDHKACSSSRRSAPFRE